MEKITLFHGTSSRIVVPTYGLGEKKHDYGKGFYLTDNLNLAKEWAVCSLMAGGADETQRCLRFQTLPGVIKKIY